MTDTTNPKDIYLRFAIFITGVVTMSYAMWQQGVKNAASINQEEINGSLKEANEQLNDRVVKLEQFIRDSHATTSNFLHVEEQEDSVVKEEVIIDTSK